MRLDGTVEVTHPNSTISVYPLDRLTKLYDGIEQLEDDGWAEDMSDVDESVGEENGEGVWLKDDDGVWRYRLEEAAVGDEWEETDDDDDEVADDNNAMDVDEEFSTDSMSPSSYREISHPQPELAPGTSPSAVIPETLNDTQTPISNGDVDHEGKKTGSTGVDLPWKRFDILASAPHDHSFYSSTPVQPSKNFLSRLTKEYRALSNSLPGVCLDCFCPTQ